MTRIDQETSYAAELVVAEPTDEEDEEEAPLQDEATPEALDPTEHRMSPMARISWTVAGLTILTWAFQLYGYVDIYPLVSLAVIGVGLWGLGTIFVAWQPRVVDRAVGRILAATTLAISIGAFVLWSFLQIVGAPAYGTDEIAFDQYAAQLLRHGLNPYTHSMAPAFSLFHVSPDGYTFLLNGHAVTSLSYPALSFLLYAPLVALGWTTQTAVVVNVLAWALGMVLAFVLLPKSIRPLAIVVGSFSVYISYAVGGVTDALFVPLLIGAVYQWDRFPTTKGFWAWRGPVLLGLAMAVKQTPWLVLPFLVAGVALEARRHDTLPRHRPGRVLGAQLGLHRVVAPSLVRRGPDTHPQPHGACGSGVGRPQPLPRHRWRLVVGVLDRALDRLSVPLRRVSRDLSGSQAVGCVVPCPRPLLLGPLIWQLPGHPGSCHHGCRLHDDRPVAHDGRRAGKRDERRSDGLH
jgi:hypothetical protein